MSDIFEKDLKARLAGGETLQDKRIREAIQKVAEERVAMLIHCKGFGNYTGNILCYNCDKEQSCKSETSIREELQKDIQEAGEENKKPKCFGTYGSHNDPHCPSDDDSWCQYVSECIKVTNERKVNDICTDREKRMSKDEYYLGIALAVSKRSTCLKRHYGAVIVKDGIIVSTGYNGSPSGEINCCDTGICARLNAERYSDYEACKSVHAEQNAIIQCTYHNLQGSTLYLACEEHVKECADTGNKCYACQSNCAYYNNIFKEDTNPIPCFICKRIIKNSGIKRIVNKSGDVLWES